MERISQPTRKYPIGIQNFEDLRRQNYLYVDKTAGKKELFEGLAIAELETEMSIFSTLNQLIDISLEQAYEEICGRSTKKTT